MGFFEKETVLELLRPTAVILAIFLIEIGTHDPTVKAVIGVIAIIALALLDYVLRKGARFRPLRRRWYPISRLEGVWAQRVHNARPYSIACIDYEGNGRWKYYGVGYDENFEQAAQWSTVSTIYSTSNKSWHFAGDAETLQYNPQFKKHVVSPRGYVVPILDLPAEQLWEKVPRLDGHVIDLKVDQKDAVFDITLFRVEDVNGTSKLPLRDEIRMMTPQQVRKILQDAHVPLIEDDTATAPPVGAHG